VTTRQVVVVIGKGRNCPVKVAAWAYQAGRAVARAEAVLVTGGLGGVMEAAARGALDEGGVSIGLTPAGRERDICREEGQVVLQTGLKIPWRNALTASVAEAAIVCPGATGTVQEGMAMRGRRVQMIAFGDHEGFPSQVLTSLCFASTSDPAQLDLLLQRTLARPLVWQ
jgi:uncharacterized protein (TIGR00725 family)